AATASVEIRLWDLTTGDTRKVLSGTGATAWAVGFARDSQTIAWGTTWKPGTASGGVPLLNPLQFELRLPFVNQPLGQPEPLREATGRDFVRGQVTAGSYLLASRRGGPYGYNALLDVIKDGKTQATIERTSADGFQHSAYTLTPDVRTIVSGGSNGVLTAYDLAGKRLGDFIGHQDDIWALAPSPDGRFLISGSADQTERLWNIRTRELIVTLFHGRDGEWVMWTPQGYYTGSPGADRIVRGQINKGPERAADTVDAEQRRQDMHRPDIIERAILLASAEQAVREAPGTTFTITDLLARPVPKFHIIDPAAGSTVSGGTIFLRLAIEPTPDPVRSIRLQVNGLQIDELTSEMDSGGFASGERILRVPLGRGRNDVRLTLINVIGETAQTLTVMHEGEGALDKRGTLFILAIGVDKYPGLGKFCGSNGAMACDLQFSGADARALAAAFEQRLGPQHRKVVKRILVNGAEPSNEPTAANIIDSLDLFRQAEENDTVLLFIAGLAINDGLNYRFLPTNAERMGDSFRGATVVPWQIIQEGLESTKGRRILFVD